MKIPRGTNLGAGSFGNGLIHGTNYAYPSSGETAAVASLGIAMCRIPYMYERIVAGPTAPLISAITDLLAKGVTQIILDPHGFGNINGREMTLQDVPGIVASNVTVFGAYKTNPAICFGFQNEPANDTTDLFVEQQAWINQMRAEGFKNTLVVTPGGWGGIDRIGGQDAAAIAALRDPLGKLVVDGHMYFDSNYSGTNPDVMGIASVDATTDGKAREWLASRMGPTIQFCRANNIKLLIGETALPDSPVGNAVRVTLLRYLEENADVMFGVTWWLLATWMGANWYNLYTDAGLTSIAARLKEAWTLVDGNVTSPPPVASPGVSIGALIDTAVVAIDSAATRPQLREMLVSARRAFL